MNYPLISEYIEAIKSAEDNFKELNYLRPVLDGDWLPVMTSGNFAVVFKMKDEQSGKFYAVKCFTKEQEGRAEAYREIAKELKDVSSPYLVSIRYLEKELFVDTDQTTETEFPVLLMDWADGIPLDKYIRENLKEKSRLELFTYRFAEMARWLIVQPFAHGDLKPDNILVREKDMQLVLVDYDGMFIPSMKGQKARELGSPDFRHPLRTDNDFDEHIDDFSLITLLLSLKLISNCPNLYWEYAKEGRLLFSQSDYLNFAECSLIKNTFPSHDRYLNTLFSLFTLLLDNFITVRFGGNSFELKLPYSDSYNKAVVYRISLRPPFGKEKPFVKVIFKREWCDVVEYPVTYDLRLIYGKECVDEAGNFDCFKAFELFSSEMHAGYVEDINLYDISLDEIPDIMMFGKIVDKTLLRERKTGKEIEFIPIATYESREKAVRLAKKRIEENIHSPIGKYCRISK